MTSVRDHVVPRNQALGGPAFRWKLAKQLAEAPGRLRRRDLDRWTSEAALYLRRLKQTNRSRAEQAYPEVAAACTLMENPSAAKTLKLSILGQLPREETAARLGVSVEVLTFAEALFFEIGELGKATGWMTANVFVPEARFGSKELAAQLKLAHFGGPFVARELLESHENLPEDEAQQIVAQEMLLHSKLRAALEFDLDQGSAVEFARLYLEYDLERQQLKFAQEQFREHLKESSEMAGKPERQDESQADRGHPQSGGKDPFKQPMV